MLCTLCNVPVNSTTVTLIMEWIKALVVYKYNDLLISFSLH